MCFLPDSLLVSLFVAHVDMHCHLCWVVGTPLRKVNRGASLQTRKKLPEYTLELAGNKIAIGGQNRHLCRKRTGDVKLVAYYRLNFNCVGSVKYEHAIRDVGSTGDIGKIAGETELYQDGRQVAFTDWWLSEPCLSMDACVGYVILSSNVASCKSTVAWPRRGPGGASV